MFNLGYKQVVLNTMDGVSSDGATVTIVGFDAIPKAEMTAAVKTVPTAPTVEVSTWVLPTLTEGEGLIVQIKLRAHDDDESHTVTFNARGIDEAAIIAGYEVYLKTYPDDNWFTLTAGLTVTINAGYEKYGTVRVQVSPTYVSCQNCGSAKILAPGTVTTQGTEGNLQGWQIEASVKLGTLTNSWAYAQQHSGNSVGVFVDKTYTAYDVTHVVDQDALHEYVKHDFVNAKKTVKDVHYVIYVMEDEVAAFDAIIAI